MGTQVDLCLEKSKLYLESEYLLFGGSVFPNFCIFILPVACMVLVIIQFYTVKKANYQETVLDV